MAEEHEPSLVLTLVAHICGWIYFTAWTLSFYPQVYRNFKQKSTEGLSYSFAGFNLIGFIALAAYDLIRLRIQNKYKLPNAVEIQDVCFAVHAVFLTTACILQVIYYDSRYISLRINRYSTTCILLLIGLGIIQTIAACSHTMPVTEYPGMNLSEYSFSAWTLTNFFAVVKIGITLFKYLPQILLNMKRRMTEGMAIWGFNLDLLGGVFSLLQNGVEAINHRSLAYITGNIPKFGIAIVGLTYNMVLLFQHYVVYKERNREAKAIGDKDISTGDDSEISDGRQVAIRA